MSYTPKQQGNSGNSSAGTNSSASGSGQSNQNAKSLVGIAGIQQQMQSLVHGQNQQTSQGANANFNSLIQRQQQFESIIKQQQQLLLSNPQFVQQMQQNVASGAGKDLLSLTRTPGATELLNKTLQSQIQQQANGNTVGSSNVPNVPPTAAQIQALQALAQTPANIMQQIQAYQIQMQQQQQQQQQQHHQSQSQQQQQQNRMQQQSYQQTQNTMGNQFAQFQTNYQQQKFLAAAAAVQQQAAAAQQQASTAVSSKTQATLGNQMKAPNLPSQTQITPIPAISSVSATTSTVQNNNLPSKTQANKPISTGTSGNSGTSKNLHTISPSAGSTPGNYSKSPIMSARPLSTVGGSHIKGLLNQPTIPGIKSSSKLPPPTQITAVPLTKPTVATSSPVKTTQSALLKTTTTTSSSINVSSVSTSKSSINCTKSEALTSITTTNISSSITQASSAVPSAVKTNSDSTIPSAKPVSTTQSSTGNATLINSNSVTTTPIILTSPPPITTTSATKSNSDVVLPTKKSIDSNKDNTTMNKTDNVNKTEAKHKDNEKKIELKKDVKKPETIKKNDVKLENSENNVIKENKLKSDDNSISKIVVNLEKIESKENVKNIADVPLDEVNDLNKNSDLKTISNEIKQSKKPDKEVKLENSKDKELKEDKILNISTLITTPAATPPEKTIVKNQRGTQKKKNEAKSEKVESKKKNDQSPIAVTNNKEKPPVKISKTPIPKSSPTTSAASTPVENDDSRRSKRHRLKTILYQSPLPELAFITKLSASEASNSPKPGSSNEDKLVLFYKNEYLAVRNADNGFFLCQTIQNVYKTSPKIRIRWLSEEKKDSCVYIPDFYDNTDIECFLTTVNLRKEKKERLRLPEIEKERIESILKKAIDVENGTLPKPNVTEENPDGLDISLYKNESQIEKKLSSSLVKKRSASKSPKRNTKKSVTKNKSLASSQTDGENDDDEPTDTTTEEEGDIEEYRPHQKMPALQVVRSQRSVLAKARAASPIINETPKKVPNKNEDKTEEPIPENNKNRGKRRSTTDPGDESPTPSKKILNNQKKQVSKISLNTTKPKKDEEAESSTSSTSGRPTRNRK